ncbi:barstar family protein [Vitreimonas flagellata]|uniref:barstar family protein n=1 Tax=Vitreimonas flagellata TaxID=2560861 RepID=UPI001074BE85|nr:barstar family protein [Vitreimonas flagellata]
MTKEYVIDGSKITSLDAFYEEVSRALIPGHKWGRNLDAFDDILSGGFGTPADGFTLRWSKSSFSKEKLGYAETVRYLEEKLRHCHASNRDFVRAELANARAKAGPTLFDWLVQIIRDHGLDGEQAEDKVRLVLD